MTQSPDMRRVSESTLRVWVQSSPAAHGRLSKIYRLAPGSCLSLPPMPRTNRAVRGSTSSRGVLTVTSTHTGFRTQPPAPARRPLQDVFRG
eukprot:5228079-Amphidinium_carterae.1